MRIHFTRLDLARTYLADGPDPMWELVNSLQALQTRYGEGVLGGWRRRAGPALHRAGLAAAVRHRLFPLAPDRRVADGPSVVDRCRGVVVSAVAFAGSRLG